MGGFSIWIIAWGVYVPKFFAKKVDIWRGFRLEKRYTLFFQFSLTTTHQVFSHTTHALLLIDDYDTQDEF